MTPEDIEKLQVILREEIRQIVKKSIEEALGQIHVDLTTPESRKHLAQDMDFLRSLRSSAENGKMTAAKMGFVTLLGAVGFLFYEGLKKALGF
jgi:hypothetical protein